MIYFAKWLKPESHNQCFFPVVRFKLILPYAHPNIPVSESLTFQDDLLSIAQPFRTVFVAG